MGDVALPAVFGAYDTLGNGGVVHEALAGF